VKFILDIKVGVLSDGFTVETSKVCNNL